VTQDRAYPPRPLLGASVAVFRGGRVLVAARARPPGQGLFSLPGGLVEPGETLAEAALRELREEVGVEARILGFVDHVEVIERDGMDRVRHHFVVCAHAARWIAGEPAAGPEALEVRWVTHDDLLLLPTTAGLPSLVARAARLAGIAP
jgi:ADP-ribose pyrophosphatase YjhB (NUDIX family)